MSTLLAAVSGSAGSFAGIVDALVTSTLPHLGPQAAPQLSGPVPHAAPQLAGSQLAAGLAMPSFFDRAAPTTVWVVVLSFVFLECAFIVGLFLPGDSLLFAAGVVLAAHDQEAGAWALALAAMIAAVAGNQVGYVIGRRTGTRILARKDGKILNRTNLNKARAFFDKWGFWAIAVARWLPWIRTLAPMIAGAAGMDNRRYLLANTLGAILWVPTLLLLGYYGAGLLSAVPWLRDAATIGSVAFFVLGTAYGLYRFRQEMRKPIDVDPVPADAQ